MSKLPVFLLATALALPALALPALAQQGQPGAHFIENWDLDEDGKVSLAEATERRDDIFTTFDENEDDRLNAEEYAAFDAARAADMAGQPGHGKGGQGRNGMRKVQQGMQRQFNDANGDGLVTRQEFLARVPAWFKTMDRSADGAITTDDFGRG